MRQRRPSTETTIVTPARTKAAGALAGGLLLMFITALTALPVHAAGPEPAMEANTHGERNDRPSAGAIPEEKSHAGAAMKHPRPAVSARRERECRGLENAIQVSEQAERRSTGAGVIESLRQDLLSLRKRYRQLGC